MRQAVWNDIVLAEADESAVQMVEGNVYFPKDSIQTAYFKPSMTHTVCPWKGTASYYTIEVDGNTNPDAAWYYPDPKPDAIKIKDHIAFWKGVKVA